MRSIRPSRPGAGQLRARPLGEDGVLDAFAAHWSSEGFLSRDHEEARYAAGEMRSAGSWPRRRTRRGAARSSDRSRCGSARTWSGDATTASTRDRRLPSSRTTSRATCGSNGRADERARVRSSSSCTRWRGRPRPASCRQPRALVPRQRRRGPRHAGAEAARPRTGDARDGRAGHPLGRLPGTSGPGRVRVLPLPPDLPIVRALRAVDRGGPMPALNPCASLTHQQGALASVRRRPIRCSAAPDQTPEPARPARPVRAGVAWWRRVPLDPGGNRRCAARGPRQCPDTVRPPTGHGRSRGMAPVLAPVAPEDLPTYAGPVTWCRRPYVPIRSRSGNGGRCGHRRRAVR